MDPMEIGASRPVPANVQRTLSKLRDRASTNAAILLERALLNHADLPDGKHEELMAQARTLLGASSSSTALLAAAAKEEEEEEAEDIGSKKPRRDEHNDMCEVCVTGGDLLCCDTCNLVFHLRCLRPKLTALPKGRWSCAHCVIDGVVSGDVSLAKEALLSMNQLARGSNSDDDGDGQSPIRIARSGEVTVVRSGKRFIVRKRTSRSQIIELGRYDTLEKALSSLVGLPEDEELWCMYCLDDPGIQICAFCGCRFCFGKHDAGFLLLCDGCNEESHTYCLSPPLTSIPADNWYCTPCVKLGRNLEVSGSGAVSDSGAAGNSDEADLRRKKKLAMRKSMSISSFGSNGNGNGGGGEGAGGENNHGRGRGRARSGSKGSPRPRGRPRKIRDEVPGETTAGGEGEVVVEKKPPSSSHHSKRKEEDQPVDAVGIDAALTVVGKMGKREATRAELQLLDQLREWAPSSDLSQVLAALHATKASLCAKISASPATGPEAASEGGGAVEAADAAAAPAS